MRPSLAGLVSTRRRALATVGGVLAATAAGRAVDNVYLGYGTIEGTNLHDQSLDAYASDRFGVHETTLDVDGHRIEVGPQTVAVEMPDQSGRRTIRPGTTAVETAARIDAEMGLSDSPCAQLLRDVDAIERGSFSFEFLGLAEFLDRGRQQTVRPYTVAAIRGPTYRAVDPDLVAELSGADPGCTTSLIEGLAAGLRARSEYDVERYLAGSIEDNVLAGKVDLRSTFHSPSSIAALVAGENDGLFCTEIAHATIEALHAVSPHHQTIPVACAHVADSRHKHAYTGIATVVREEGELVVPMTFVDYMDPLLADTLHVRWLLGDSLDAYDQNHRATAIYWNQYAGVA